MDKVRRTDGTHLAAPPIGHSVEPSSGGVSRGKPEPNLENRWESQIRSLEQWLCKLLIKNEQLRMSLALAERERRGDSGCRPWERPIQTDEP
jgi:hypothetical protein